MRTSCNTRITLVLVRSRPARYACAEPRPISNWASVSGSAARISRTFAVAASRASAFLSLRAVGDSSSAAPRMRSISTVTSSGLVSHTSLRMSHSFGPRLPNSRMNASKPSRYWADDGSRRDSSHIARLGAAESTSPRLVMRVSASDGSPSAAATAPSTPGPIDEPAVIARCRRNRWRSSGARPRAWATSCSSVRAARSGRAARAAFDCSRSSRSSGRSVAVITLPIHAPIRSVTARFSCHGSGT
jgi:hypothetical protein